MNDNEIAPGGTAERRCEEIGNPMEMTDHSESILVEPEVCAKPLGRCSDEAYRLAVYQSGHALVARALGHRIIQIRMLPRPPITITDKTFVGNNWDSFMEVLEKRVIELFGGQIAEEIICDATHCCTGDIHRIDELTRLLAGLMDIPDHEEIFFRFEKVAQDIFEKEEYRALITPLSEFLFAKEEKGEYEIPGIEVEAVINRHLGPLQANQKKGLGSLFGLFRS